MIRRLPTALLLPCGLGLLLACTKTLELGHPVSDGAAGSDDDSDAQGQGGRGEEEGEGGQGGSEDIQQCRDGTGERHLDHTMREPLVLIAVERTRSMLQRFGISNSRLDAVRGALAAALLKSPVRAGLIVFPALPGEKPCGIEFACCQAELLVPPVPPDEAAIKISDGLKCGATSCPAFPETAATDSALAKSLEYLDIAGAHLRKRVLLFTDGDPDCSLGACEKAIFSASELRRRGIAVTIMAMGTEALRAQCLPKIAAAARGGETDLPFTSVGSSTDMDMIVAAYFAQARMDLCVVSLESRSRSERNIRVLLDGKTIPHDNNGWDFTDDDDHDQITLRGSACAQLLASQDPDLDIYEDCCLGSFGCHP